MMNFRRCENGHYYDADKYMTCPHCGKMVSSIEATIALETEDLPEEIMSRLSLDEDKPEENIRAAGTENETPSLEEAVLEATAPRESDRERPEAYEAEKTVSFYKDAFGTEPVVGWLTCIEGLHYGKSFGLRSGRTFIGRNPGNDVVLAGDVSVSREKHAVILYDPKARCFIAQQGDSRELFYLNDRLIISNEVLKAYDVISIGNERLLFIPMCGEQFCWEDTKKKAAV